MINLNSQFKKYSFSLSAKRASKGLNKSSFTLVELMIVLAILAILATVLIFILRPGGVLDTTRDYNRVSDLNNITKAINYLNTWAMGNLVLGSSTTVYVSLPDNTSTTCTNWSLPTLPAGYSYQCANTTNYRKNDATGWIPINFRESDNSNILSSLPVDPTNNITYYYTYFPGGSFELTAQLTKARDASLNDNGSGTLLYETGTPLHVPTPVLRETNLILNYKFSEGTGTTTYDSSGHGYTGTLVGPAWTALTSTEQTMYYDAVGADYISTSSFAIPNTGILTIEAWTKSKLNAPENQGIMGDGSPNGAIGYIYMFRGKDSYGIAYGYANGTVTQYIGSSIFFQNFNDIWLHIVVVCDYTNKKAYFYKNGEQIGVPDILTGTPVFPSIARIKYMGAYSAGGSKLTDGSLDEVRIYNRGLGADEITARYNQTRGRYQ